ncbi:MAG: PAS domain S-box protein [Ignavibacteriae bacterium]|nr:PAS domain S-box protein [Ignavibacteriota bacterium]
MKFSTVLIVEDEKIVGMHLASILQQLGYIIVDVVSTGSEAVEIACDKKPDIILMDIGLSGELDGIETSRKIQQNENIPVVFISGNSDMDSIEKAMNGNAYGYVFKPFDEREIRPVLEIALYRHQYERNLNSDGNHHPKTNHNENDEQYHSLAELSSDCIIIHVNGKIVFVNQSAVQTLKAKSARELIGKKALDFVHPEYHETVNKRTKNAIENNILPDVAEEKYIRLDKSEFFVKMRTSVLNYKGEKGMQVVFQDITEQKYNEEVLKKSETLFRQVWENSRDGKRLVNKDGIILLANPAYCQMVGKPAHDVIGQIYSNVYAEEQQPGLLSTFRQRIGTHSIVTHYEKKLRLWNGKELWLELSNSYVDAEGENGPFLLSIIRDITERKIVEEQIRSSLMEKEALLKELHHRVKNNMQIVSSLLHLQAQNIQDKAIAAPLRESQNRVKSMALVHEQLYQSDSLSEVNINVYLRQLTSRLLRSILSNKQNVSIGIKPENDMILMNIDTAIPIGLILNELITNALKYAFVGKENGEIGISIDKNHKNLYQIIVKDNGIGLPADIDITKTETLGLQLVQSLAAQLGGKSECTSTSNGTIFTITFPER